MIVFDISMMKNIFNKDNTSHLNNTKNILLIIVEKIK